MDWLNIKKTLIIALILTNVILFSFLIYNKCLIYNNELSDNFITETTKLLKNKNINIKTNIPKKIKSLNSLIVNFNTFDSTSLNANAFNNKGMIEAPSSDFVTIKYNSEIISIINKRRLRYENISEKNLYNIKGLEDAKKIAVQFLKRLNFNTNNLKNTFFKEEDGNYILYFSKIYNDVFLERSYTNFVINNKGVISMDRMWLDVDKISNKKVNIIPVSKALLKLLNNSNYYNKTITDIKECYYFDPEEEGYIKDITKALKGRTIPAWRIQFSDGDNIEIYNS